MKVKDSKAAIEFLEEASRYFEKRPTYGEDKAYWSNVYNAENCLEIVKLIEAKDSQIRTLEKGMLDLSVDVNDQVKEIGKLRAALEDAAKGFEVNGLYTRANKIYKVLDREK